MDTVVFGRTGLEVERRRPRLRWAQPARPVVRRERRGVGRARAPRARPRHHLRRHRAGVRDRGASSGDGRRGRPRRRGDLVEGVAAHRATASCSTPPGCAPRSRRRWPRSTPTGSTSTTCTVSATTSTPTASTSWSPSWNACATPGAIRFLAHLRAVRGRSRPRHVATRGRRRLLGRDDGRLQPAEPERTRPRVLGHPRTDVAIEVMFAVRRALSRPDELARVVQELVDRRATSTPATSTSTSRSGSWCTTAARRRWSRRRTGSCATSPAVTWSSPAPGSVDTPRGERPVDLRAAAAGATTSTGSVTCSATSTICRATDDGEAIDDEEARRCATT